MHLSKNGNILDNVRVVDWKGNKMRVEFSEYHVKVVREDGDPKFYGVGYGKGESRLFYNLKKLLNSQGYDLIKKRMWKDGHLTDDTRQYLRARKHYKEGWKNIAIHNGRWAIAGAEEDWNTDGEVTLDVVRDYWEGEK